MAESSVICATDDQWGRELHLKENAAAKQVIVKKMITTLKHFPQQCNTSNEQMYLQDIKNPIATVVAKFYEEAAKELSHKHTNGARDKDKALSMEAPDYNVKNLVAQKAKFTETRLEPIFLSLSIL